MLRFSWLTVLLTACATAAPGTSAGKAGESCAGSVPSGGLARTFWFHLPAHDAPGVRPLVLSLHGRLGTGKNQESLSRLSALSDRDGFLVVYPDGISRSWADARGGSPASHQGVDDVQFLSDLIDLFVREQRADPARVFVTGMSNGAMMALTAACRLSEKVAAVAAVGGLLPEPLVASCRPSRPVSVVFIHGTEDPLVPYAGGTLSRGRGTIVSADDSASVWAHLDGCRPASPSEPLPDRAPDDGTTTTLTRWGPCSAGSKVALYSVRGGGHTWPGGPQYLPKLVIGRTSRDFDASQAILGFFGLEN